MGPPVLTRLVFVIAGCADPPAPAALEPVAAVAPVAPAKAPEAPLPRLDPSNRLNDGVVRPIPWMPDDPQVEAVLPTTQATLLVEGWELMDIDGSERLRHTVSGIFEAPDPARFLVDLSAAVDRWEGTARADIPLVYTFVAADRTAPAAPRVLRWLDRDGPTGKRPVMIVAEPFDARHVQLLATVILDTADVGALTTFASTCPEPELRAALVALGDLVRVEDQRDLRSGMCTFKVRRVVSEAETRAVDAILARERPPEVEFEEFLADGGRRLQRAREPFLKTWRRDGRRALQAGGFPSVDDQGVSERGDAYVLVDDTSLVLGLPRPPR